MLSPFTKGIRPFLIYLTKHYRAMNHSIRMLILVCLALQTALSAQAANLNLLKSTPVGSWQLRRELHTDDRGKQTIQETRTSLLGKEKRDGVDHVWIEMVTESFNVRKGEKGKQEGEPVIIKVLMEEKLLGGKPEDIINNMRGLGKEIIMQQGNAEPILIEEGGALGNAMMQAVGAEIKYDFKELAKENVETPAGKFNSKVIEGSGTTEIKIVFRTMRINGTSKQWMSDKVPFSIVKMESSSETGGKVSKVQGEVVEFGMSGAVSRIKGEPQRMNLPSLGNLFGG
jgi:hypothetical protein